MHPILLHLRDCVTGKRRLVAICRRNFDQGMYVAGDDTNNKRGSTAHDAADEGDAQGLRHASESAHQAAGQSELQTAFERAYEKMLHEPPPSVGCTSTRIYKTVHKYLQTIL